MLAQPEKDSTQLQFTGNWLIDAGMLGFVNLMEEVYGWDLKSNDWKLPISNNELQGRFTFAFFCKEISSRVEQLLKKDNFKKVVLDDNEKNKITRNVLDTIKQNIRHTIQKIKFDDLTAIEYSIIDFNKKCKECINNEFQNYKDSLKSDNKKTILEKVNDIGFVAYNEFFTNLFIFNNATNKIGSELTILQQFSELICKYYVRENTDVLDKSLNAFLFSADKFNNIYFGKPPTLKKIEEAYQINPTYLLLSIRWSFIQIQKYYFFHTNSLENSYYFHHYLQKHKELFQTNRRLLDITWQALIDLLVERKADFSLENIHIIEYSGIAKQTIQDVEYLSISKLNATLLVDDIIRENLNKSIPYVENKKKIEYNWLIEQLLSEKPLTPLIISHVDLSIRKNNVVLSLNPSIYALMIDANKQKLSTSELHFDHNFFSGYDDIVDNIKKDTNYIRYASDAFSKCITDDEQKLYRLLATIKGNDRNQYLNLLYLVLIKSENEQDKKFVSDFVFKNIIKNKKTWSYYGLALVLKAIKQWKNMKK